MNYVLAVTGKYGIEYLIHENNEQIIYEVSASAWFLGFHSVLAALPNSFIYSQSSGSSKLLMNCLCYMGASSIRFSNVSGQLRGLNSN